ncbi:glutathione S-transferase family protein [Bradyrhizobium elkanii]|uniref:glutathione S-transferase family protein n=1 Tax=Bradyrhizobium elkanii TaxID=29448 RepID=UPI0035146D85
MSQPTPILHHFDQSPFSEKIRIIFGFKKLAWNSVRISRIMPRPDLVPMTGGYRRTPTMQIGSDIYCDTQIIIRELERRYPTPTLFPAGNAGMPWALGMWTDRPFFQNTVSLVFGFIGDKVPRDFIEDREKLRGGKFDVAAMTAALPQMRDQFRANVDWIEAQLGDGRPWLFGEFSLADVSAYMNVWYARQSLATMDEIMKSFPARCGMGGARPHHRPRYAHRDVVGRRARDRGEGAAAVACVRRPHGPERSQARRRRCRDAG